MTHFSPLLWLCSLSAALLNTYAALDPTGAYAEYLDRLDTDSPAITAFFTAAQDGVYPWTIPALPDADDASGAALPEDAATPAPDETVEIVEPAKPVATVLAVDESYFDDALFLGDSHTDGLHCYAPFLNATYFTKNGLSLAQVFTKSYAEVDDRKLTLEEAMAGKRYGKIYLMLGINEVNYESVESYLEQYRAMLTTLREWQPDALLIIQSVLHTTQAKSASSDFTNERINAYNEALQTLADGETIFYLDVNPIFDDETGALKSELSGDGIHVRAPYYKLWRELLCANGVVIEMPSE